MKTAFLTNIWVQLKCYSKMSRFFFLLLLLCKLRKFSVKIFTRQSTINDYSKSLTFHYCSCQYYSECLVPASIIPNTLFLPVLFRMPCSCQYYSECLVPASIIPNALLKCSCQYYSGCLVKKLFKMRLFNSLSWLD